MASARPSRAAGVSQLRKNCWQIRKMSFSNDHDGAAPGEDGGHAAVDLGAHHVAAAGEQHQRHQGERGAEGQHDLAEHQRLGGVHPGRSSAASCSQRSFASSTRARTSLSPGVSIHLCEHASHGRHETQQTPLQLRNHVSPVRVSRPRRHHASSIVAIQPESGLHCGRARLPADAGCARRRVGGRGGGGPPRCYGGAVAGGSQGPSVNSWVRASRASMPHLPAVDR